MNKRKIKDLEDEVYFATREVEEVRYFLGHKIKILEEQNAIMRRCLNLILIDPIHKPKNAYGWEAIRERDVRDARQALAEVKEVELKNE